MPDEIEPMIRIGNTIPPQFLNDQGKWELVRGGGGAYRMQSQTKVSRSPFSGSSTMTKEFSDVMSYFVISNDGNADLTFAINDGEGSGDTYKVYAGAVWGDDLPPFTSVTITTTVPFQAYGKLATGTIVVVPTPTDTTAPDNVTNLTTSALTATSLTLTWSASASNDCIGYDICRGSTLLASVTGTTYNVAGLTQATQYTFTVKAKDAADNIASGTATTITTSSSSDTTPPADVTNLTTDNITQTGLTLNWTASVSGDVASYDVYNGSSFVANIAGNTYNVNGLSASTSYTFWVKAKDSSGNSATGTSVSATTSAPVADTTAPSNVTGLSTSSLTQSGVTLTWSAATDNVAVTGYEVYNGATLVTTVSALTYNVTGLTASTQYTFTVKARDAAGNVATGTSTTFTTTAAADTTPPNAITGLSSGTPTSSTVPLMWTISSSGDVANQEVAYSSNGGSSYTIASAVINPSSNSYTVTGLAANQAYTFRVVAIDGAVNRSTAVTTTATTAASADTTPPEVVTSLAAGTPTTTTVPLTWTASVASDISKYEVAYSTDGTNFTIASAVVTGTSYTVTGLVANTLYTFRVASVDTSNNRSSSNPTAQATTAASSQTTYVSDDFNRSDSSSLGTATTGQTWTGGSLQIIGQQTGTNTTLTGPPAWSVTESSHADNVEISLDAVFPAAGWSSLATGIVFRFASGSAMYCFGPKSDTSVGIYQAGATGVTIPSNATVPSMAGTTHTFKVKIVGQLVECYLDGVLKMSITDTMLTANTKHGIGIYNCANGPKFDNFSVKSV